MVDKKVMTIFNYIGGKGWLKKYLREEINLKIKNKKFISYVEPFAGGLGAFLGIYDILIENNIKYVILNDINSKLINFYKIVNIKPEDLIKEYMLLETAYGKTIPEGVNVLHRTKDKDKLKILLVEADKFYKNVRNKFNEQQSEIDSAVSLLFLQNHCFNGIYRENSKGGYNTPFNWEYKTFLEEKIREKILAVGEVFNQFNITFSNKSFQELKYDEMTLYYLDPPYVNEIEKQENNYNKDSFNIDKQKMLIQNLKNMSFIYSNHDNVILIEEFFKNNININVKKIARKNIISCSNESRKFDKIEILVSSII
jgi:DNA adenine methylase Dam